MSAFSKDHKDSMAPYADFANWEEHIKSIETVERGANDKLVVYMIMQVDRVPPLPRGSVLTADVAFTGREVKRRLRMPKRATSDVPKKSVNFEPPNP